MDNYKEEKRELRAKLYDREEQVATLQTALTLAKETLMKSEDEKADIREELEEVKKEIEAHREKIDELAISAIGCDSERQNLEVELQESQAAAKAKVAEVQAAAEAKMAEVQAAADLKVEEVQAAADLKVEETQAAADLKVEEARVATRTKVTAEFRAVSPAANVKEIFVANQLSKAKANLETSLKIIKAYEAVLAKYAAVPPKVVAAEFFKEVVKMMDEEARASGDPCKFAFQKDAHAVLEKYAPLHRELTQSGFLLAVPTPALMTPRALAFRDVPESPEPGPSRAPEEIAPPSRSEDHVAVEKLLNLSFAGEGPEETDTNSVVSEASAAEEGDLSAQEGGNNKGKKSSDEMRLCSTCNKYFKQSNFSNHKQSHNPVKCKECGKELSRGTSLTRHLKNPNACELEKKRRGILEK